MTRKKKLDGPSGKVLSLDKKGKKRDAKPRAELAGDDKGDHQLRRFELKHECLARYAEGAVPSFGGERVDSESSGRAFPHVIRLVPSGAGIGRRRRSPLPPRESNCKVSAFTHEHLGQLNTYVSWYKRNVMTKADNPPIGMLLCTHKDHALVEYALADLPNRPFVSKFQLELPSREQLQQFLNAQIAGE
jgi:hypothetical protein